MPISARLLAGTASSDSPRKRTSPPRGGRSPEMARSVVVLPAPFEPSKVTISPSSTRSETPNSTCTSP